MAPLLALAALQNVTIDKVIPECAFPQHTIDILSHHVLGRVCCMGGSSSKEASIKLNQDILGINIQNLGKHEVFFHYSHTSVDDSAFCSKEPRLLSVNDRGGALKT